MKRKDLTFFFLSLVLCVIVVLQLVNHFVMFGGKSEAGYVCTCDGTSPHDRRRANGPESAPVRRQRTFEEHVNGLLHALDSMNEVEKTQLRAGFQQLHSLLAEIRDTRSGVTNSRKLSEKLERSESRSSEGAEIQEICPEKFMGKELTYGYPFFRKGFATLNCTQFVPVRDLVTIVFDNVHTARMDSPAHERVLQGLAKYFPEVNVVYITSDKPEKAIEKLKSKVRVLHVKKNVKLGKMWLDALGHVTTKYVLIAPNLVAFDDDVDLKRMLRILSNNPDVTLVSGSYRTRNGHWDIGCQQSGFRNYTLTLRGGYYLSFWECVVCDYAPGPWAARTKELRELKFDERLDFGAFLDIFLKVKKDKKIAVSCPDVMFNIDQQEGEDKQFVEFVEKYDIKKIVEPDGRVRWYGCRRGIAHRSSRKCPQRKGLALPPCDMENLADAVKLIMRECEKAGLFCELQGGTLFGAVKFNGVLPWERDADITFLTANYTAFKKLGPKFKAAGYSFMPHDESVWCCVDGRQAGGKVMMSADGWSIQLYGQHLMESEMQVARGESPTKVDFAGEMVTAVQNPGLHCRNRYGEKIYRHQEHWMDRGMPSGWQFYTPGKFEKCPTEGHSGCLSQYSVDGNMQFERNTCPCTLRSPAR